MAAPRTRWTDERLDDLAVLMKTTDTRVDRNERQLDNQQHTLDEITTAAKHRRDDSRALRIAIYAVLAAELLQIAAHFAHLG